MASIYNIIIVIASAYEMYAFVSQTRCKRGSGLALGLELIHYAFISNSAYYSIPLCLPVMPIMLLKLTYYSQIMFNFLYTTNYRIFYYTEA